MCVMVLAHQIRLDPNNVERTYFARTAGTARFAYNWALAEWGRQYAASKADPALKPPNEAALRRKLNSIKREQFPWMLDVTKCAPQLAIMQLGRAFENFLARRARYPTFRREVSMTGFPSVTTSSRSTAGASVFQSWAGYACAKPCVLPATLYRPPSHAKPITGTSASLSTVWIHLCHLPKTRAWSELDLGITHLAILSTGETLDFASSSLLRPGGCQAAAMTTTERTTCLSRAAVS